MISAAACSRWVTGDRHVPRRGARLVASHNGTYVLEVFPYHDENKTIHTPLVTFALIAANVAVWFFVQGAGADYPLAASVCNLGLIPGELTGLATPGTGTQLGDGLWCLIDQGREPQHIFTSMFLHGGWMHLLGNMWFLWLFGNNVEDVMGRPRYVAFYLLCGIAAALAQVAAAPASKIAMVGASGAISGVMGGYVVLYPRVRVFVLVPIVFFLTTIALPAWVMLGYWMLLQLLGGFNGIGGGESGGVAFFAHVGGFVAGAVLVKLFARRDYLAKHTGHQWRPSRFEPRR
jgi:membrane associated rhomboid family serine protease